MCYNDTKGPQASINRKGYPAMNGNILNLHYDCSPRQVLRDPEFFTKKVPFMKAAGVKTMWLCDLVYGRWYGTAEDISRAKKMLEDEGFDVQAITVPLGHGSNALNGNDPDPSLPADWKNRVDVNGNRMGTTTCIDDTVIKWYRDALEIHKEIGFTQVFHDDDLRLGMFGPDLQGCFCERCMSRFYKAYPQFDGMSRTDIVRLGTPGSEVRDAWETIQCDSIRRFMRETTPEGMTPGIMVMHCGDRRHGIDIAGIKQDFPNAIFRVGESHFHDGAVNHPLYPAALKRGIGKHLALIGSVENAFSETTTYPVGALCPENLVKKMKVEIECGLRNIFLMGGNKFYTDDFWEALIAARSELEELAASTPLPVLDGTPVEEDFIYHG